VCHFGVVGFGMGCGKRGWEGGRAGGLETAFFQTIQVFLYPGWVSKLDY